MAAVPSVGRSSYAGGPALAPQAAATEGLYERHAAKILGYCLHQLGSREEAEDAVQTTFMNAFRALGRGVVPEAESAWLFKIAENVCLSRRRSSWRRGRIESPSDFDVIEEVVPGPSRQRDELIGIEDALASMPEQQRRAILLREWQGLSYREISEELELSQSAVETLIFRGRRSLAQGLEQPELVKQKPRRKSFRRALHVIDLGTIAAAAKTLLAGSAAVKATAAAVAVTAAATAASVTPKLEGHSPQPAQARALVAPSSAAPEAAAAPARLTPAAAAAHYDAAARPVAATRAPAQHQQQARSTDETATRPAPAAAAPVASAAEAPAAPPTTGSSAAPVAAEPSAQPPVAEQPTLTPAPAQQPSPEEPKPVEPTILDTAAPKQGDQLVPVAPAPAPELPVAPILTEQRTDLKEPVVSGIVVAPIEPISIVQPVTDSQLGN